MANVDLTRTENFKHLCRKIYGDRYGAELSREIGLTESHISRYNTGRQEVPKILMKFLELRSREIFTDPEKVIARRLHNSSDPMRELGLLIARLTDLQ